MKFLKYLVVGALLFATPAWAIDAIIKDPDGTAARVNSEGQLTVKAIVETQLTDTSEDTGLSFAWSSTYTTGAADEEVITIRNDSSDLKLHFDQIWIAASISNAFTVGIVTSGTPASAGAAVTGQPLNDDLSKVADATALGNASVTGTVVGTTKAYLVVGAGGPSVLFDLEGAWISGKNDTLFISSSQNVAEIWVTVIGHFDED